MKSDIKKIHPFPARMAPEILTAYLAKQKKFNVFDPMVGSGTSLINALAHGHNVEGTDLDPLACLLTKVWCSRRRIDGLDVICRRIVERAQSRQTKLSAVDAFPKHCDNETKEFIKFWFDLKNRKQLTLLSQEIAAISNKRTQELLWVALSRLIIAKKRGVSLAMDLSHSRPHKAFKIAPIAALEHFCDSVDFVDQALRHNRNFLKKGNVSVKRGDARKMKIKSNTKDLVLTSPPYLNAIDYIRCSKFALVWMGYNLSELRDVRSQSIGSERARLKELNDLAAIEKLLTSKMNVNGLSQRRRNLLIQYSHDLDQVFAETHRVLKKHGRAVFVIGNCFIENTKVDNAYLAINLAKRNGMNLVSRKTRIIPPNKRYMPPPSKSQKSSMSSRMREEVILEFKKQENYSRSSTTSL